MRQRGWTIAILVLAAALLSDRIGGTARPAVFAHRGATAGPESAPENTAASIAQAVSAGAYGVEFDVQMSRDGTLWLLHDDTLDRTTDASGSIVASSDAALRAAHVDGGLGWRAAFLGLGLTTLDQALVAAGSRVRLNVDLKTRTAVAAERLADVLRSAGLAHRTIVNVKSHDQATILRSGAPGVTIMAQPDWIADAMTATDVDIVLVWGAQLPTALRVRPAAQIGLFRNVVAEARIPDLTIWEQARTSHVAIYLSDDLRVTAR